MGCKHKNIKQLPKIKKKQLQLGTAKRFLWTKPYMVGPPGESGDWLLGLLCQLSDDIYYKTFKCQLRSFCGQLFSLSLPINFQPRLLAPSTQTNRQMVSQSCVSWPGLCLFSFGSFQQRSPARLARHDVILAREKKGRIGCQVVFWSTALTEAFRKDFVSKVVAVFRLKWKGNGRNISNDSDEWGLISSWFMARSLVFLIIPRWLLECLMFRRTKPPKILA